MKYCSWLFLAFASCALMACHNSAFDSAMSVVEPIMDPHMPSAEKTEISISDDNFADGVTPALVQVKLKSGMGAPVVGANIGIEVSGTNNVVVPCTSSDQQGLSKCWVYTTKAEIKRIRITGAINKTADLSFQPPLPLRNNFAFVSAATDQKLPSGHRIISTAGIVEAPTRLKDVNGVVRVRTSVLGSIINE